MHTVPDDDDPLLNPYPLCDYVNTLEANYKKAHLQEYNAINSSFGLTYQAVANMINIDVSKINSPENLDGVYDVFASDLYDGWPMPDGFNDEIWKNMTYLDNFRWFFRYADEMENKLMNANFF